MLEGNSRTPARVQRRPGGLKVMVGGLESELSSADHPSYSSAKGHNPCLTMVCVILAQESGPLMSSNQQLGGPGDRQARRGQWGALVI